MLWVSPSTALDRYASAVVGRLLNPVSSATAVSRGPGGYRDTFHEAAPVECKIVYFKQCRNLVKKKLREHEN